MAYVEYIGFRLLRFRAGATEFDSLVFFRQILFINLNEI